MASSTELYSSNSNDAIQISLVVPGMGAPRTVHSFNPQFTYPIFGEQESIFGYQGLNIHLRYHRSDMRPCVQISYEKKFRTVGETSALDIPSVLSPFLPKTAWEKEKDFDAHISNQAKSTWTPPGQLCTTIEDNGLTYEVWMGNLSDPAVHTMLKRLQIFVLFFIEGGSFIELQDEDWSLGRWTVFFLYQRHANLVADGVSPHVFMGYSTVYRYYYFQPLTPPPTPRKKKMALNPKSLVDFELPLKNVAFSNLPCRSRISQFVILPPYQGGGNGSRFYNAIYQNYLADDQTVEITVEDPNEAFDDMRDINDLIHLRLDVPTFKALHINTDIKPDHDNHVPDDIVPQSAIDNVRKMVKMAPRQFARVLEMQLLSRLPKSIRKRQWFDPDDEAEEILDGPADEEDPEKEHEYHLWSLLVKTRLYRHNRDMLMQMDPPERVTHLEKTLKSVQADYVRLLDVVNGRMGIDEEEEERMIKKRTLSSGDIKADEERLVKKKRDSDATDIKEEPARKKARIIVRESMREAEVKKEMTEPERKKASIMADAMEE